MSGSNSKTWENFMQGEYAQQELNKIANKKKEAQQWSVQNERDPLYNVDPGSSTELSKSVQTQGVNAGGASMVGSEDRGPLYTTSPAAVPGGQEQYADTTVEGLEDVASAMMNVATKEPHANPRGSQDNASESWDGIQAAGGKKVRNFTKKAQELVLEDQLTSDDQGDDLESILAEIEKEELEEEGHGEMMMDQLTVGGNQKKKTVALLKELVKIANECDEKGQYRDASEIDNVIKDEVQTLLASQKKKK